jgi:hypothetical protein
MLHIALNNIKRNAGSKSMAPSDEVFAAHLVSIQALVLAEQVMLCQGIFRFN